ncbi:MAG: DUF3137 domain-containing protein [Clostridia bacterium]|nr:DUF3137 domain-containing protein [Clostridia bacterium]
MKSVYDRQIDRMHSEIGKFTIKQQKQSAQNNQVSARYFYSKSGNPFIEFLQYPKQPEKKIDDVNKLLDDIKSTTNSFNKLFKCFALLIICAVVLTVITAFFRSPETIWIVYGAIAVLFITFGVFVCKLYSKAQKPLYNIFDYKRYIVNNTISEFVPIDNIIYEAAEGVPLDVVKDTKLFDRCYFVRNENFFSGKHNGIYFAYADIEITDDNEETSGFFDGCIISLKCPNDFKGIVTMTDRKYEFPAKKKHKNLTTIMTNNSFIDNSFIVKTDDENLARWLLVPEVIRLLMYLKQISNGSVLVSFKDGYMHIFINDEARFFDIDMKNPDINSDINNCRKSMDYICNIIDQLCD